MFGYSGVKDCLINYWHKRSFIRVTKLMDDLSESENFSLKKASSLLKKYGGLIAKTCNNPSLHEKDRDAWSIAVSHSYEASQYILALRILEETQK